MNNQSKEIRPPRWSQRLLRFFLRKEYLEEIEGDIDEVFDDYLEKYSVKKARWLYSKEVFKAMRPTLTKRLIKTEKLNYLGMLQHNIIITLRGFRRHKTTFLINLIGLSTGLAASLLIFLWVMDEKNVDKFHEKDDRLYQVIKNKVYPDGIITDPGSPALLANALIDELPEIEHAVTVNNSGGVGSHGILTYGEKSIEVDGLFASSDFFDVFTYPLVAGDPNRLLTTPNDIVLTESLAMSLFNTTDNLIGKDLKSHRKLMNSKVITGIIADPPKNSTVQFDFVINYQTVFDNVDWLNEWSADGVYTYLTLKQETDVKAFNSKLKYFLADKPDQEGNELFLQKYSSRYLNGEFKNGLPSGGRIAYVRLLTIVGIFILLIACINFMNLSTAQASRKMKEVGVKKVFGVKRSGLVTQFMTEALLMVLIASAFASLMIASLLPVMNTITAKQLEVNLNSSVIAPIIGAIVLVVFLAGAYPSFYLSSFKPIAVLKGKLNSTFGDLWIRRGLVILQFVISVLFISGVLVINKQISFIQNADMGYNRDNVIHFAMSIRNEDDRKSFLNELKTIAGVINATYQYGGSIVEMNGAGRGFSWGNPAENELIRFGRPQVGYDFIETLGINVIEGRSFSRDFGDESSKLIINQAAADIIGIENIVGQTIMDGDLEKQVIGIVENFKMRSLYEKMEPTIIRFVPQGWDILVKIHPESQAATIAKIQEIYDSFNPIYPFSPSFVDDEHQAVYISEQRISTLSKYFTIVAIIISCLGLLGLATFTAERRIKEIGIRKILGSSRLKIIMLLTNEFGKIVMIAILIGLPLSYYFTSDWLDNFAYATELNWWIFTLAGVLSLAIAWFTVGLQTFKAASVNPAKCLRNE